MLPHFAYFFTRGPWKSCWIRYAFDPRVTPAARMFAPNFRHSSLFQFDVFLDWQIPTHRGQACPHERITAAQARAL